MSLAVGATMSRTRVVVVLEEASEVFVVTQAVAVTVPSTSGEVLRPVKVTVPAPAPRRCCLRCRGDDGGRAVGQGQVDGVARERAGGEGDLDADREPAGV